MMMRTILLLAAFGLLPIGAIAKDWTIERVDSRALVRADGSVEIREFRTYRFEGSYTRAEVDIRKMGFDRLHSIQVLENGVPYLESDSKDPGTYLIRDRNRSVEIRWRYAAADETRTFEIRYVLEGAIVTGPDHAEWYWTFIGDKWDRSTLSWTLDVRFQNGTRADRVHLWAHGDVSGLISLDGDGGRVAAEAGRIDRREGIRVRMVFPSAWVPGQDVTEPGFNLAAAQADEAAKTARAVADAERDDAIAAIFRDLLWLLIIGPVFVWGWYFNRYGRRHQPLVRIPETGHTPPSAMSPAIVSWFLTMRTVQSHALVSTLLDLARRGYLTVETQTEKTRWTRKDQIRIGFAADPPDASGLMEHERMVLAFIPGDTTLEDLFKRNPGESAKWYAEWCQTVGKEGNSFGWYDVESRKGMYQAMALCAVFFLASIFAAIYLGSSGVIALILSTTALVSSAVIERKTPEGQTAHAVWTAYSRGLKQGNAKELGAVPTGTHLVYAVALGMAGKRLTERLETLGADPVVDVWLTGPNFNPALFADQIGGMVASASAGVSSGSGTSSGSAGGGGGGGAG
jgi:hypothetical protein